MLRLDFGHDVRDRRTWTLRNQANGDTYQYYDDSELNVYRHEVNRPDLNFNNAAAWTDTFAYDAAGNRTSVNENGSVTTYTPGDDNRYTAVTGASGSAIAHDARGNITTWDGKTFTYDADNRLRSVSGTGLTMTLDYDGDGRLVKLVKNGTAEYRFYDGAQCFLRTNAGGAQLDWTVWGPTPDEVVARNVSSGWQYYHQDPINSVVAVTDSTGLVVERYLYDVFGLPDIRDSNGNSRASTAIDNPWLFTGQEWRGDIGLSNYKARWYQPTLGRFMQNDPVRFDAGDINLYRYCGNDSINRVDPDGQVFIAGALLGAGIDLGVQLYMNGGDFSKVNLTQVGVSALVGATGAGLGSVVANGIKTAGLAGAKAAAVSVAANSAGSGVISATGKAVQNAIEGKPLSEGVGQAAKAGAAFGAAGAVASEAVGALGSAMSKGAMESSSLATKLSASGAAGGASDVLEVAKKSLQSADNAAATSLGLTISNATPTVDLAKGEQKLPEKK